MFENLLNIYHAVDITYTRFSLCRTSFISA